MVFTSQISVSRVQPYFRISYIKESFQRNSRKSGVLVYPKKQLLHFPKKQSLYFPNITLASQKEISLYRVGLFLNAPLLWVTLGSFGVPLGSFGVPPWAPFGSLWPASGSPVPGEVASSEVPRIAIRSAFFELIPGIPGIPGSGVIQCCSEPPFHAQES